jgi:hypothetical protein
VHPRAVEVAHRHGLALDPAGTANVSDVIGDGDLVIAVCDNAHEGLGGPIRPGSTPTKRSRRPTPISTTASRGSHPPSTAEEFSLHHAPARPVAPSARRVHRHRTASHKDRSAGHLWIGEVVATAGLLLLIFTIARSGRAAGAPAAVGAYIGGAYWFTSSTSFANPAVTVGRAFTDTFAGIAPASIAGFVVAQIAGLVAGLGLLAALYPDAAATAGDLVVEHDIGVTSTR